MGVPLYRAKSELFRAVAHPVRIRVLELLDAIAIGASRLSQQLAVLRGTGLVLTRRDGNTVEYSLSAGEVTDLVDVYHACALALVMATPPELQLPDGLDHALADRAADAATQAFHRISRHSHDTRSS